MFTKLAQNNVDLHDNHPTTYALLGLAVTGTAVVAFNKFMKKLCNVPSN